MHLVPEIMYRNVQKRIIHASSIVSITQPSIENRMQTQTAALCDIESNLESHWSVISS